VPWKSHKCCRNLCVACRGAFTTLFLIFGGCPLIYGSYLPRRVKDWESDMKSTMGICPRSTPGLTFHWLLVIFTPSPQNNLIPDKGLCVHITSSVTHVRVSLEYLKYEHTMSIYVQRLQINVCLSQLMSHSSFHPMRLLPSNEEPEELIRYAACLN
jgi:hypothetical protein